MTSRTLAPRFTLRDYVNVCICNSYSMYNGCFFEAKNTCWSILIFGLFGNRTRLKSRAAPASSGGVVRLGLYCVTSCHTAIQRLAQTEHSSHAIHVLSAFHVVVESQEPPTIWRSRTSLRGGHERKMGVGQGPRPGYLQPSQIQRQAKYFNVFCIYRTGL